MVEINKSWIVTLVPLILSLGAIVGDTHPEFGKLINEQTIMGLLGAFGIAGGAGVVNKVKKEKARVEQTKAINESKSINLDKEIHDKDIEMRQREMELDRVNKERDREVKKEIEIEKVKAEVRKAEIEKDKQVEIEKIKQIKTESKESKTESQIKILTPDQFNDLTPLQQDDFVNNGGVVTTRIQSTGEQRWNNQGGWFDTTFDSDANLGAVITRGTRYIWFRADDAKDGITIIIRDAKDNVIQIEQAPGGHIARIESDRFIVGEYEYKITAMRLGTSYTLSAKGKFNVI